MSHHNSFVLIVNAALGGGDDKGKGTTGAPMAGYKDAAAGHATPEAAVAAINRMLLMA